MILSKFSRWRECDIKDYTFCYQLFGGNFSSNPSTLEYIHSKSKVEYRYLTHYGKNGKMDGAICVWNNKYLANGTTGFLRKINPYLPIAEDELIMPLSKDFHDIIPLRAKILSPAQPRIIVNSTQLINAKRSISLFKGIDKFSKKTQATLNRKIKRFINSGGEIIDNEQLSSLELTKLYIDLFYARRNIKICNEVLNEFIHHFRKNIFGKILFVNGQPCAYMLNIKNETANIITIDFINIARDPAYDKFSVGNILMWINALEAEKQRNGKVLRFSFGRPTAEYKTKMCFNQRLKRIISI